jgi:hypothetical protein
LKFYSTQSDIDKAGNLVSVEKMVLLVVNLFWFICVYATLELDKELPNVAFVNFVVKL